MAWMPDLPAGYATWNAYIKDWLAADREYQPGHPETARLGRGDTDESGSTAINPYSLASGDLFPFLDASDPEIADFMSSLRNAETWQERGQDQFSIWGDQFSTAILGLGLFVGGSAALGAFTSAPAAATGGAAGTTGYAGLESAGPVLLDVAGEAGGVVAAGGGTTLGTLGAAGTTAAGGTAAGTAGGSTAAGTTAGGTAGTLTNAEAGALAAGGGASTGGSLLKTAATVAPIVSAAGSVLGEVLNYVAAGDAADTQSDAARQARSDILKMYEQNREDFKPYREAGVTALGKLEDITAEPFDYPAWDEKKYPALDPSKYTFVPPTAETLPDDPGYKFRVQEGQRALEASASARGTTLSGGTLRALERYRQGQASQEYQSAYDRALGRNKLTYGRDLEENTTEYARAKDAYTTNYDVETGVRTRNFNENASIAGLGQTSTTTLARLGSAAADSAAERTTEAANAEAAGTVAETNAITKGVTSLGNAFQSYLNNQLLLDRYGY